MRVWRRHRCTTRVVRLALFWRLGRREKPARSPKYAIASLRHGFTCHELTAALTEARHHQVNDCAAPSKTIAVEQTALHLFRQTTVCLAPHRRNPLIADDDTEPNKEKRASSGQTPDGNEPNTCDKSPPTSCDTAAHVTEPTDTTSPGASKGDTLLDRIAQQQQFGRTSTVLLRHRPSSPLGASMAPSIDPSKRTEQHSVRSPAAAAAAAHTQPQHPTSLSFSSPSVSSGAAFTDRLPSVEPLSLSSLFEAKPSRHAPSSITTSASQTTKRSRAKGSPMAHPSSSTVVPTQPATSPLPSNEDVRRRRSTTADGTAPSTALPSSHTEEEEAASAGGRRATLQSAPLPFDDKGVSPSSAVSAAEGTSLRTALSVPGFFPSPTTQLPVKDASYEAAPPTVGMSSRTPPSNPPPPPLSPAAAVIPISLLQKLHNTVEGKRISWDTLLTQQPALHRLSILSEREYWTAHYATQCSAVSLKAPPPSSPPTPPPPLFLCTSATGTGKSVLVPLFFLDAHWTTLLHRIRATIAQHRRAQTLTTTTEEEEETDGSSGGSAHSSDGERVRPQGEAESVRHEGGGSDHLRAFNVHTSTKQFADDFQNCSRVCIVVSQPTRVACVELARYTAALFAQSSAANAASHDSATGSDSGVVGMRVGYAVGGESCFTPQTEIVFATPGYILNVLQLSASSSTTTSSSSSTTTASTTSAASATSAADRRDALLLRPTTLIVDEAHCRDLETDLLMAWIKCYREERAGALDAYERKTSEAPPPHSPARPSSSLSLAHDATPHPVPRLLTHRHASRVVLRQVVVMSATMQLRPMLHYFTLPPRLHPQLMSFAAHRAALPSLATAPSRTSARSEPTPRAAFAELSEAGTAPLAAEANGRGGTEGRDEEQHQQQLLAVMEAEAAGVFAPVETSGPYRVENYFVDDLVTHLRHSALLSAPWTSVEGRNKDNTVARRRWQSSAVRGARQRHGRRRGREGSDPSPVTRVSTLLPVLLTAESDKMVSMLASAFAYASARPATVLSVQQANQLASFLLDLLQLVRLRWVKPSDGGGNVSQWSPPSAHASNGGVESEEVGLLNRSTMTTATAATTALGSVNRTVSSDAHPASVLVFLPGFAEIQLVLQALERICKRRTTTATTNSPSSPTPVVTFAAEANANTNERINRSHLPSSLSSAPSAFTALHDPVLVLQYREEVFSVPVLHAAAVGSPQEYLDASAHCGTPMRLILATSVAESSLTIPNVKVVVDSCLERRFRADPFTGTTVKQTALVDGSSLRQRAGRAGRTCDGVVIRLAPRRLFQLALSPKSPVSSSSSSSPASSSTLPPAEDGGATAASHTTPLSTPQQTSSALDGAAATESEANAHSAVTSASRPPPPPPLLSPLPESTVTILLRVKALFGRDTSVVLQRMPRPPGVLSLESAFSTLLDLELLEEGAPEPLDAANGGPRHVEGGGGTLPGSSAASSTSAFLRDLLRDIDHSTLTAKGRIVSAMPLPPEQAQLIYHALQFNCVEDAVLIACAMTVPSLFLSPHVSAVSILSSPSPSQQQHQQQQPHGSRLLHRPPTRLFSSEDTAIATPSVMTGVPAVSDDAHGAPPALSPLEQYYHHLYVQRKLAGFAVPGEDEEGLHHDCSSSNCDDVKGLDETVSYLKEREGDNGSAHAAKVRVSSETKRVATPFAQTRHGHLSEPLMLRELLLQWYTCSSLAELTEMQSFYNLNRSALRSVDLAVAQCCARLIRLLVVAQEEQTALQRLEMEQTGRSAQGRQRGDTVETKVRLEGGVAGASATAPRGRVPAMNEADTHDYYYYQQCVQPAVTAEDVDSPSLPLAGKAPKPPTVRRRPYASGATATALHAMRHTLLVDPAWPAECHRQLLKSLQRLRQAAQVRASLRSTSNRREGLSQWYGSDDTIASLLQTHYLSQLDMAARRATRQPLPPQAVAALHPSVSAALRVEEERAASNVASAVLPSPSSPSAVAAAAAAHSAWSDEALRRSAALQTAQLEAHHEVLFRRRYQFIYGAAEDRLCAAFIAAYARHTMRGDDGGFRRHQRRLTRNGQTLQADLDHTCSFNVDVRAASELSWFVAPQAHREESTSGDATVREGAESENASLVTNGSREESGSLASDGGSEQQMSDGVTRFASQNTANAERTATAANPSPPMPRSSRSDRTLTPSMVYAALQPYLRGAGLAQVELFQSGRTAVLRFGAMGFRPLFRAFGQQQQPRGADRDEREAEETMKTKQMEADQKTVASAQGDHGAAAATTKPTGKCEATGLSVEALLQPVVLPRKYASAGEERPASSSPSPTPPLGAAAAAAQGDGSDDALSREKERRLFSGGNPLVQLAPFGVSLMIAAQSALQRIPLELPQPLPSTTVDLNGAQQNASSPTLKHNGAPTSHVVVSSGSAVSDVATALPPLVTSRPAVSAFPARVFFSRGGTSLSSSSEQQQKQQRRRLPLKGSPSNTMAARQSEEQLPRFPSEEEEAAAADRFSDLAVTWSSDAGVQSTLPLQAVLPLGLSHLFPTPTTEEWERSVTAATVSKGMPVASHTQTERAPTATTVLTPSPQRTESVQTSHEVSSSSSTKKTEWPSAQDTFESSSESVLFSVVGPIQFTRRVFWRTSLPSVAWMWSAHQKHKQQQLASRTLPSVASSREEEVSAVSSVQSADTVHAVSPVRSRSSSSSAATAAALSGLVFCEVCNVLCTGEQRFQSHCRSVYHLRRLQFATIHGITRAEWHALYGLPQPVSLPSTSAMSDSSESADGRTRTAPDDAVGSAERTALAVGGSSFAALLLRRNGPVDAAPDTVNRQSSQLIDAGTSLRPVPTAPSQSALSSSLLHEPSPTQQRTARRGSRRAMAMELRTCAASSQSFLNALQWNTTSVQGDHKATPLAIAGGLLSTGSGSTTAAIELPAQAARREEALELTFSAGEDERVASSASDDCRRGNGRRRGTDHGNNGSALLRQLYQSPPILTAQYLWVLNISGEETLLQTAGPVERPQRTTTTMMVTTTGGAPSAEFPDASTSSAAAAVSVSARPTSLQSHRDGNGTAEAALTSQVEPGGSSSSRAQSVPSLPLTSLFVLAGYLAASSTTFPTALLFNAAHTHVHGIMLHDCGVWSLPTPVHVSQLSVLARVADGRGWPGLLLPQQPARTSTNDSAMHSPSPAPSRASTAIPLAARSRDVYDGLHWCVASEHCPECTFEGTLESAQAATQREMEQRASALTSASASRGGLAHARGAAQSAASKHGASTAIQEQQNLPRGPMTPEDVQQLLALEEHIDPHRYVASTLLLVLQEYVLARRNMVSLSDYVERVIAKLDLLPEPSAGLSAVSSRNGSARGASVKSAGDLCQSYKRGGVLRLLAFLSHRAPQSLEDILRDVGCQFTAPPSALTALACGDVGDDVADTVKRTSNGVPSSTRGSSSSATSPSSFWGTALRPRQLAEEGAALEHLFTPPPVLPSLLPSPQFAQFLRNYYTLRRRRGGDGMETVTRAATYQASLRAASASSSSSAASSSSPRQRHKGGRVAQRERPPFAMSAESGREEQSLPQTPPRSLVVPGVYRDALPTRERF